MSNNTTRKHKIIIELGYDLLGKRRRKTVTFYGTNEEYKIKKAELTKEYYHSNNNIKVSSHTFKKNNLKDISFEEYSILFITNYCEENISKITTRDYKQLLVKINKLIGRIKLRDISSLMLDNMYKKIKNSREEKPLSPKTMLGYYNLVNKMFNQAVKWNIIEKNPNINATRPKQYKKERKFYDNEESKKLLMCLCEENIKYRALITLVFDSGARRSEIVALRWPDIDFNNHTIHFDNSLKVINGKVDETEAKTPQSKRIIYVSDTTIRILKEYKEWQEKCIKKFGDKWIGTNRVFTSKYGDHMHPDTCGKIINKILKKHDLNKITFHELRHTSATVLLESGMNPKAVMERLGHAKSNVTMEIYAHVNNETRKKSADLIEEIIVKATE